MPRGFALVPARRSSTRRVTRTQGGTALAPTGPARVTGHRRGYACPWGPLARTKRTPGHGASDRPGTRKRGVHEYGSAARLESPAPLRPSRGRPDPAGPPSRPAEAPRPGPVGRRGLVRGDPHPDLPGPRPPHHLSGPRQRYDRPGPRQPRGRLRTRLVRPGRVPFRPRDSVVLGLRRGAARVLLSDFLGPAAPRESAARHVPVGPGPARRRTADVEPAHLARPAEGRRDR